MISGRLCGSTKTSAAATRITTIFGTISKENDQGGRIRIAESAAAADSTDTSGAGRAVIQLTLTYTPHWNVNYNPG